jgi:hypothetical protein
MNDVTAVFNYFLVFLIVVFFTNLELVDLRVELLVGVAFSEREVVVILRLHILREVGGNSGDNSILTGTEEV